MLRNLENVAMGLEESSRLCKRNLLAVSVFISFYYYAGLNIDSISFFGARSSLENNDAIILTLWVIWAYFFLRYIQFYLAFGHPAIKKVKEDVLHAELVGMLINIKGDKLKLLEDDHYVKRLRVNFRPFVFFSRVRERGSPAKLEYQLKRSSRNIGRSLNLLNYVFEKKHGYGVLGSPWNAQIVFSDIVYEDPDGVRGRYRMSVSQTRVAFFRIFKVYMVHPATSEYMLPILLAFSPLVFLYHA